ncbi:hypothetical protein [Saccharibacillus alkalitolerans]|uniref:Uncharacterized protein n=1 Tax=Saccharibacillus alkalitolerans TaxID=2705290 RepID=A0ABX0F7C9_9BACL|nr:hypothetical protein [Saccharibacillus alkalitolerans]NGZ75101.1 hypothetical protein [Saccharibacillus alkalitolerans]
MLTYLLLAFMLLSLGFIGYRTVRHGPEYRLVENAGLAVVILVAASALGEAAGAGDWFRWARYAYAVLGAAYIAYGAYAKYRGGTDGYGQ